MRIVFAGTPVFAAVALQALVDHHFDVVLVLTQPDRPAGRGLHELPSAVKQLTLRHGLPLVQAHTLRDEKILAQLRSTRAQVMVVAAYGLILPPDVLDIFPGGCINIHASLLPRWRGAAPIQRAILAGDSQTGISIMQMEQGLDTGPVYLARPIPILPDDSAGSLHERLAEVGAQCIVEVLRQFENGAPTSTPQATEGITYAHKVSKSEAAIQWQRDSVDVDRQVRAFNPFPGAFSLLRNTPVKIWRGLARADGQGAPGQILAHGPDGIDVACGKGMLRITELQKAGGTRLSGAEFLRGLLPLAGERFSS